MEKKDNNKLYALVGKNISYSFSRGYFTEKFETLQLHDHQYINFDFQCMDEFMPKLKEHTSELKGMNVTIPYKLQIFDYLDEIDEEAKTIGAVNTIKILEDGRLKGYNTDVYGFEKSLIPLLRPIHKKALILGTGGASKAVAHVLEKLQIAYSFVSRSNTNTKCISYDVLDEAIIGSHLLIINCTPLGTHPNIADCPALPYQFIAENHLLYDLIYNPAETKFLKKGKKNGAVIKNGMEMLEQQAEKAWEIWNS